MSATVTFQCILADPPWEYRHKVTGRGGRGAASHHYSTMTLPEIQALNIPCAKDAFLWMWVTNPVLAEGWPAQICASWGFKPQSILTWVKPGIGMGYTLRSATEHILVARRGHPKVLDHGVPTWFSAKRLRHSEKPDAAYLIIERLCEGPRLEMFARKKREGWASWGNEVQCDVSISTTLDCT